MNEISLGGIFSEGYGVVPKKLMKAKDISSNTKLILCYLLSYTGQGIACFPQIKSLVEDLSISQRTVVRCIKEAQENGYLKKHQEHKGRGIGKRNIYELLFMHDYPSIKENIASAKIARVNNARANNDINTPLLVPPEHDEYKHVINNNNTVFPENLNNVSFIQVWNEWIRYRADRRCKLTKATVDKQLELLSKNGADAIEIVNRSILNGWQGLFPLPANYKYERKKDENKKDNTLTKASMKQYEDTLKKEREALGI